MLVESKLSYEEFVDLMFLLGGDNVERMKRCWKLVTGERLYWKGDGIVEVRGISAVDNFSRLLSDFLDGVSLKGLIEYLVKYGGIRKKLKRKFWFNKYV